MLSEQEYRTRDSQLEELVLLAGPATTKLQNMSRSMDSIGIPEYLRSSHYSNDGDDDFLHQEYSIKLRSVPSRHFSPYYFHRKFVFKLESEILSTRFNQVGNLIAVGTFEGSVVVLDCENGTVRKNLGVSREQEAVSALRWKPGSANADILTATTVDGEIVSFNVNNGRMRYRIPKRNGSQLLSLDYSLDASQIVVGDQLGNISLISDEFQKELRQFKAASWFNCGHSNRVFSVKFYPDDPNVFLSGGWDGMIFLWDVRDPKPVGQIDGQKMSGDTLDCKANRILAASHSATEPIKIFDFLKRELVTSIANVNSPARNQSFFWRIHARSRRSQFFPWIVTSKFAFFLRTSPQELLGVPSYLDSRRFRKGNICDSYQLYRKPSCLWLQRQTSLTHQRKQLRITSMIFKTNSTFTLQINLDKFHQKFY